MFLAGLSFAVDVEYDVSSVIDRGKVDPFVQRKLGRALDRVLLGDGAALVFGLFGVEGEDGFPMLADFQLVTAWTLQE